MKKRNNWNLTNLSFTYGFKGNFRLNHDIASCYYSLDNKNWKKIGEDFKMKFDYRRLFIGTRFAIFNYATNSLGGYVDVDYFDYKKTE
mgnify:CR=1 FL=1